MEKRLLRRLYSSRMTARMTTERIPILILAGSDRRPGRVGPGLTSDAMLSGYKGALLLRNGRCLAAELVARLRATERFADPILFGPRHVFEHLVDCETVHVEGSLANTLSQVLTTIRSRFEPDRPVAISSVDILPSVEEFQTLLADGYDPNADCHFWWQITAADPQELGASSWKPRYGLRSSRNGPLQSVYPGHFVILRPAALRLELLNRLLVAAYRYRNWPLHHRVLPLLARGIALLIKQDLLNLLRFQLPLLTVSIPWHILRAYWGIRKGSLTLDTFQRHLARTVVHRGFRREPHPFVVTMTPIASFAKDIDTLGELQEATGHFQPEGPQSKTADV